VNADVDAGKGSGRAVVLGGTGFVGRHIADALTRAGQAVTVVSRRAGGAGAVAMDLTTSSPQAVAEVLDELRAGVVVNAAGCYWGLPEDDMRTSFVTLTERVLAALPRTACRPRLIQLGTVMEYAPTPPGVRLTEAAPIGPTGGYGRTKLAATEAVLAAMTAGVDAVVLRITNSVGPGAHRSSLLGKVAYALLDARGTGRPATLELAPLRAQRDYLDVRDLGDAVAAAATAPKAPGSVVNIGTGRAVPVRDLVNGLVEVSGHEAHIIEREPPSGSPVSPGATAEWLEVDPGTAHRLLGWTATRTLKGALSDFWSDLAGPGSP
jgi:dTDP-6-deoxy-L-talose 4-dehydrogenase [NAD(P)+]